MKLLSKNKILRLNFFIAAGLFFAVMVVYLFTLAPTITAEDSGELITAAHTLGIAHPPGFPLYVLLGKLFTFIPLGSIAWRVNLMSAFFGALTIALVYLSINKLVKNKILAAAGALILAFSATFWSQSVIAEVYTLNTFFVALLVLILLTWQEKLHNKYLYLFSFLYGLSLTNHTASVLLAPAFAGFIVLTDKSIVENWKLILKMFGLFLAGLLPYFYIPLRAYQQASLNWGPITTWLDVWQHITRAQYNDFSPLTNNFSKTGIALSFFLEIYKQFLLPSLFLALGGAIYLWKKNKAVFVMTVGIFVFSSFGIIYLRKFGWNLGIDYTYRVYYLPTYIMVVIWLAVILNYLAGFINGVIKTKSSNIFISLKIIFYLIVLSLPVSFLYMNYDDNNYSGYWIVYDYSKNLLESLDENSVYYFAYDGSLQGDTEIFALLYLKKVEGLRPDVSVVSEQQFFYKEVDLDLPGEYFKLGFEPKREAIFRLLKKVDSRPIFTNFAVTKDYADLELFSLSNGYAFKIYPGLKEAYDDRFEQDIAFIRGLDQIDEFTDYATAGLAAHYYYNLAHFYLAKGHFHKSQEYLITAFNLDTAPFNHEYSRFLQYRKEWFDFEDTNS